MKRLMSIYICLVLVALSAVAQNKVSFKTKELKEVANKLKLDSLDTLGVGYSLWQETSTSWSFGKMAMT